MNTEFTVFISFGLAEISLKGIFVIEKMEYHFFNGGYKADLWIRMEELH